MYILIFDLRKLVLIASPLLVSCGNLADSNFCPGIIECQATTTPTPTPSPTAAGTASVSYTGNNGTVGNTQLLVGNGSGLLSFDDIGTSLTTGTFTTTLGGSVEIFSNGAFLYTPPVGMTGDDTFVYQTNTKTVTATISIAGMVWYVENTASAGGDGRSHARFQTLAAAEAASSAGDTIYIYQGNGTSTNQNAGITLKDNQVLLGNGVALVRLGRMLVPPSNNPVIGNSLGAAVTLANGNEIRGLRIDGVRNQAINASSSITDLFIDQIEITGVNNSNDPGIRLSGFVGTLEIYQSSLTTTTADMGNAIEVSTSGSNTLNAIIAQNTIDGSSASGDILNGISITVGSGGGVGTQNIRIIENTITRIEGGVSQIGIDIAPKGDTALDLLIDGNSISRTGDAGIKVTSSDNSTPRMDVIDNTISTAGGRGIYVEAANSSVGNSQILSNTISNPSDSGIRVRANNMAGIIADINSNTVASNTGTVIFTSNGGSGTNAHFNVRNNTITGSPSHDFEVTYTTTAGAGSTCSRFTGNDVSGSTPSSSHLRANQEPGSSQSLEDTVGGSATVNAYVQASNTGFSNFNFVVGAPTLVASGTCSLLGNIRPTISNIANQTVSVSSSLSGIGFSVTDVEDSDASLTVTVDSSDQNLVPNANISVNNLGGSSRSLDITPTATFSGEALIIVTVTDSSGLISIEVFKLTVS